MILRAQGQPQPPLLALALALALPLAPAPQERGREGDMLFLCHARTIRQHPIRPIQRNDATGSDVLTS